MANWSERSIRLQPHHLWKTKPGYKIFVAERGAVRVDVPDYWIIIADDTSIRFHDRRPPDDDCTLQLSVMRLPSFDWSGLPISRVLTEFSRNDRREILFRGEIVPFRRSGLEGAWTEVRFRDPGEGREALSRICLARKSDIQALIAFDYWAEDATRLDPVWNEILDSLRLALAIEDPSLGDPGRG
jgi:hypothetical protein